jgi:hypothetical protein
MRHHPLRSMIFHFSLEAAECAQQASSKVFNRPATLPWQFALRHDCNKLLNGRKKGGKPTRRAHRPVANEWPITAPVI